MKNLIIAATALFVTWQAQGQSTCNLSLNSGSCSGGNVVSGVVQVTAVAGADIYVDNADVGNSSYSWNTTSLTGSHTLDECEYVSDYVPQQTCSQVWVPDYVWVDDYVCDEYDSYGNCIDYVDDGYYENDGYYETVCTTTNVNDPQYECGPKVTVSIPPPPLPTASLTYNGQSGTVTGQVGVSGTITWSSTNATGESTVYYIDSPACGITASSSHPASWAPDGATASGSIVTGAWPACIAGHTLTWVYSAGNITGGAASQLSITFPAAGPPPPAPTASITYNGSTGNVSGTVGVAGSIAWSSTGAASESTVYYVDSPACGITASKSSPASWAPNGSTAIGSSATGVWPSCIAGHTMTFVYTATNSGGSATSTLSITFAPPPAPTASITYNGSSGNVSGTVGIAGTIAWSSTNATSESTVYYIDSPACGITASVSNPASWADGNTASGSSATGAWPACVAGHTMTWVYTATNSGGSKTSTLSITFAQPPPPPNPTASLTYNGQSGDITAQVGTAGTIAWSSTNAISESTVYYIDSPACGITASKSSPASWAPTGSTASGSSATGAWPACIAGHTFTFVYTVKNSAGVTASSSLSLVFAGQTVAQPTASLTYDGSSGDVTGQLGVSGTIAWSSTNATSESTVYYIDSPACGITASKSSPASWSPDGATASGSITTGAWPSCVAGHTMTWVYTAINSAGSASSTLSITWPPPSAPTASITYDGNSGDVTGQLGVAGTIAWNSTNATSESTVYYIDSPACGITASKSDPASWADGNTASGSSATGAWPSCVAGHTMTWVYTAAGSGGTVTSTLSITFP